MKRRTFLSTTAVGASLAVTGCLSGDDDDFDSQMASARTQFEEAAVWFDETIGQLTLRDSPDVNASELEESVSHARTHVNDAQAAAGDDAERTEADKLESLLTFFEELSAVMTTLDGLLAHLDEADEQMEVGNWEEAVSTAEQAEAEMADAQAQFTASQDAFDALDEDKWAAVESVSYDELATDMQELSALFTALEAFVTAFRQLTELLILFEEAEEPLIQGAEALDNDNFDVASEQLGLASDQLMDVSEKAGEVVATVDIQVEHLPEASQQDLDATRCEAEAFRDGIALFAEAASHWKESAEYYADGDETNGWEAYDRGFDALDDGEARMAEADQCTSI